jgi:predicted DNA-binding protein (UPF0251 family)
MIPSSSMCCTMLLQVSATAIDYHKHSKLIPTLLANNLSTGVQIICEELKMYKLCILLHLQMNTCGLSMNIVI